jgi:hypothetical protein
MQETVHDLRQRDVIFIEQEGTGQILTGRSEIALEAFARDGALNAR